jgi:predicted DsbA family dithiol-disulfide isomerase
MRPGTVANIMTGVLTGCAVVVTAMLIRREFFPPAPDTGPQETNVRNWKMYASVGQRMGATNGLVTLTEFSDFQCPFCRQLAQRIDTVQKLHPNQVAVVYRHYPLATLHPHARAAALAAECAGDQGRFSEMHTLLFAKQDSIGTLSWMEFGMRARVPDTAAMARCIRDSTFAAEVDRDVAAGKRLGIEGTPALLVDGTFVHGAPSLQRLNELVESALRRGGRKPQQASDPNPVDSAMARMEDKLAARVRPAKADSSACVTMAASQDSIPELTHARLASLRSDFVDKVKMHAACVGMTRDELTASWGLPPTMHVQRQGNTRFYEWIYETRTVFLTDSVVTAIR